MAGRASFTWYDYDDEPSSTGIHTADITSANFDATVTAVNTLRSAMNQLCLVFASKSDIADNLWNNLQAALDPLAQREVKWLVTVADVTNTKYAAMEIPCADLSILENGSKYLVKQGTVVVTAAAADVQAFVDAFEAVATDRFGQALNVWEIEQVGRNR